jgi:hypothetical protein
MKITFLSELCKVMKPKLLCITETQLNPDIANSEINIAHYNILCTDRKSRVGCGGVGVR